MVGYSIPVHHATFATRLPVLVYKLASAVNDHFEDHQSTHFGYLTTTGKIQQHPFLLLARTHVVLLSWLRALHTVHNRSTFAMQLWHSHACHSTVTSCFLLSLCFCCPPEIPCVSSLQAQDMGMCPSSSRTGVCACALELQHVACSKRYALIKMHKMLH